MEGRLGVNEDAVSVIVGILHPHGHVGLKVTDGSVIYELGFGIVFGTFDPVVQNSLICLPVVSYATDYLQRTDIEIFRHTKIRIHIEEIGLPEEIAGSVLFGSGDFLRRAVVCRCV